MKNKDILCVDNSLDTRELLLKTLLQNRGYEIRSCRDGNEAIELVRQNTYFAIILDNWIGSTSGLCLFSEIRKFDQQTPVIFFSTTPLSPTRKQEIRSDAQTYLAEDFDNVVETITVLTSTNL